MHGEARDVQVLQACVDDEDESQFRILVDKKQVKYLTIDGGIYDIDDMCFGPALVSLLPPLPPGDWNEGRISRDDTSGTAQFASVSKRAFAGIVTSWHQTRVDHLELQLGDKLRSGVYEATCPRFPSTVVAKFARFEWEIPQLEQETMAYAWIDGQQIGPAFLGHLTEDGRVIGFIMESIDNYHHATQEDLALCSLALSRLHQLGIKHGDINKHNFLIHDGKATIIDFDAASRPVRNTELTEELDALEGRLKDDSGRGGNITEIE